MSLIAHRRKIIDILTVAALIVGVAALIAFPKETVDAAKSGLTLCYNVIVPSLFPFFVLSSLVVETGVARYLGIACERVMRPLFNVGGECAAAFVLGFIGGYPVGAKTVIALYESGSCTKPEAERLLSFCNNSGPAFIFGVVGAGVFGSGKIGLLLYLAHTVASVIVGICFRGWGKSDARAETRRAVPRRRATFSAAFTTSVTSSFTATLGICGFVIFFTVFIKMLFLSGALPGLASLLGSALSPLGFTAQWAERLLTGFVELSSGVWTLRGAAGTLTGSVAMAAFMLGWAGLSVHSQVLSFIGESGLSVKTYILGKLAQASLSAALIFLIARFFPISVPAVFLAQQVTGYVGITFGQAIAVSGVGSVTVCGLFVLLAWWVDKKG
ncbi:MAG: sporulation protein [Oscillospiraceae bacterium]|jgi:sporulation integral membrane protein YlbJ|nr:sporulation protein [Oscillospiraceae bacterium]